MIINPFRFAGGGGGPTVKDSNTAAQTGSEGLFEFPLQDWYAQKFIAGSSYTLTEFHLWMSKSGSPTGNMTPHIYSHDSGNDSPNSSLGSGNSRSIAGLSASETEETFNGLSVSITSGTTYWVVIFSDTLQATNEVLWYYNGNSTSGESRMRDGDGVGVWTTVSVSTGFKFATYG